MADPITTYAIDNAGPYNVVANSYCRRILVQEDCDSTHPPTADLKQYIPASSATPARVFKGTPAIYTRPQPGDLFTPGEIAGAIQTAAGSITVQQIESKLI